MKGKKGIPDGTLHVLALSSKNQESASGYIWTIRLDFQRGGQVTPTQRYFKGRGTTPLVSRAMAAEEMLRWLEQEVNP